MGSACTWSVRRFCGPRLRATMASSSTQAATPHERRRRTAVHLGLSELNENPFESLGGPPNQPDASFKIVQVPTERSRLRRRAPSGRRRRDERVRFVAVSWGAYQPHAPYSNLLPTQLDLIDRRRLAACRTRARRNERRLRARCQVGTLRVAHSRWQEQHVSYVLSVRAAHRIAGRARVASPAHGLCWLRQCPAAFQSRATAVSRVARRTRQDFALSIFSISVVLSPSPRSSAPTPRTSGLAPSRRRT